ncbi:MAG: GntR family transcriptional regulator [Pseudomonadota bacterium]
MTILAKLDRAEPSASARAHRALTDKIMARTLRGGDALVEGRLAAELGISRTPLREALQRLEGEGLVVKTPHQPYTVRRVDLADYLQSLRVREVLEAEAAALATGRVSIAAIDAARKTLLALEKLDPYDVHAHWASDDEVHRLFIDGCGNAVMARILYELRATTRLFETAQLADRLGPDQREHLAILDALSAGNADAVRRATAAHARSLFRFAVDQMG